MTITQKNRVITPAYGRDYSTADEVAADFLNNRDFRLQPEGIYCSLTDFAEGVPVIIRYAKQQKTTTVTVVQRKNQKAVA